MSLSAKSCTMVQKNCFRSLQHSSVSSMCFQYWQISSLPTDLKVKATSDSLSLPPLVLGLKRFCIPLRWTRTSVHDWSFHLHGCHAYIQFPWAFPLFLNNFCNIITIFHWHYFNLVSSWPGRFLYNILHRFLWRQFSFCSKFSCPLFHIILILRPNF